MKNLSLISLCIMAISIVGCEQADEPAAAKKVDQAVTATPAKPDVKETSSTDMEKSATDTTAEYVDKGKEVVVEKTKEVVETVKTKADELKDDAKDEAAKLMEKNSLPQ